MNREYPLFSVVLCLQLTANLLPGNEEDDWHRRPLRPEVSPSFDTKQGPQPADKTFTIRAGDVEGTAGAWVKRFHVTGGDHYRFLALRHTSGVKSPRRSAPAKITWQDTRGKLVRGYGEDLARPEYPADNGTNAQGWTRVTATYRAPPGAKFALVELHLRWAQNAEVRWRDISLAKTTAPPNRKVRLASIHFRPQGNKSAKANRELFAPYIARAAAKKADLVCLGEALTLVGTGLNYVDVAEVIPGPSTEYFGALSKKHNLYLVAGLLERSGPAVYNTAVLMAPDGSLQGKYRKVCLPREEIEGGVTPGKDYPVFQTRFGKLGMMICWDVHFPEVARNLSVHGAEVIAMPIWGGNPALAAARAIENQIFLVSSTYSSPQSDTMKSGVWDQTGKLLAQGRNWGEVHVVEVDLAKRKQWPWLGDFKARIHRERPTGGFRD